MYITICINCGIKIVRKTLTLQEKLTINIQGGLICKYCLKELNYE